MPTIAAGSSSVFTIPAGQAATVKGDGIAVLIYPLSSPIALIGTSVIGPFDTARIVNMTASSAIDYTLAVPVPGGGSNAALGILAKPVISAPAIAGSPVTASFTAVGIPSPSTAIQWLLDGVNISGATANPYSSQASDAGKALSVRVTATNTSGSLTSTSDAVTVQAGSGTPTPGVPTILSAVGFNNRAMVQVRAPSSGDTPTSYEITSSNGQVATVASNGMPFQAMTIGSQPNGTPVTFTVKGVIGSAKSAASNASVACTPVASRLMSATNNTLSYDARHATNSQGFTVMTFIATSTFSSLELRYNNYYNALRQETNGTGTLTVEASVRKGAGIRHMTSGGNSSAVAAAGDQAIFEKQSLGFTVNKGEEFTVVTKGVSTGQIMFQSWYAADGVMRAKYGTNITDSVDTVDVSTIPVATGGGATGAFIFGPCEILTDVDAPCVGIMLDSNGVGRGDTGDAARAQGIFMRACASLGIGTTNGSISGNRLYGNGSDGFIARSPKAQARINATCTHAIDEGGINDVGAGRTAVQVQGDRTVLATSKFPNLVMAHTTLFPILQSSPASPLTPVSAQVPDPTFSPVVAEFNGLVRSDTAYAYLDANKAVCAGSDQTRFFDGATVEGTHLTQLGSTNGAIALAAEFSKFIAV